MPYYDYRCSACKHTFEEFHSINETLKGTDCPECKAAASLEIVIPPVGVMYYAGNTAARKHIQQMEDTVTAARSTKTAKKLGF